MPRALETRESLRHAAYGCFRDLGYHEASVDTICRVAGASKGSFYYHYGSKQDCFIDILETWTREVMSEVQKQFEEATQARNPFASLQAAFRRENERGKLIVPLWLEFTVLARREPAIREVIARFYHRARLAIAEMLRPFVGDLIEPGELDGLSGAILGVYLGGVTQELADPSNATANANSEAVLNLMARIFARIDRMDEATARSDRGTDAAGRRRQRSAQPEGARISDADFEAFMTPYSGPVRQCMADLRELVLAQAPVADERVVRGWRVIAYDLGGLFCALKPRRADVDLTFHHGLELEDPKGLLGGRAKNARSVSVRADAIPARPLSALIRQAAELQLARRVED